jgi:protein transport protein SEC24
MFASQENIKSALGSALLVSEKLLHPIGGRITAFISSLPSIGPGTITSKDTTSPIKMDKLNMSASTDFYKKLALECSSQQIAVDIFTFSNKTQQVDLTTISTIAKYSSGQIKYYQNFHVANPYVTEKLKRDFKRYLTRNIGFEAVMRIRCTEGLSLHTFHGNFFVRSTDLLSLPNVNPDHGYCMNMAIDESLKDFPTICIQAALLYTTYRGERRIRVHTLCLPVTDQIPQLYASLNVQAISCVLAKMAADRLVTATLGDARDALMNTIIDSTKAYRSNLATSQQLSQFSLPSSIKLLPLLTLSLLKDDFTQQQQQQQQYFGLYPEYEGRY